MARDDHQLKFRVPEGLKQRIERRAREEGRSLNAEIIATLEDAYPPLIPLEQVFSDLLRHFGNATRPQDAHVLLDTLQWLENNIEDKLAGKLETDDSEEHLRDLLKRTQAEIAKIPHRRENPYSAGLRSGPR